MGEYSRPQLVEDLKIWTRKSKKGELTQIRLHLKNVRIPLQTWELDVQPMNFQDLVEEIERKVISTAETTDGVCYFELFGCWGESDRPQGTIHFSLYIPGTEVTREGEPDAPNAKGAFEQSLRVLERREEMTNRLIVDLFGQFRHELSRVGALASQFAEDNVALQKIGMENFRVQQKLLNEQTERDIKVMKERRKDKLAEEGMEIVKAYAPIIASKFDPKAPLLGVAKGSSPKELAAAKGEQPETDAGSEGEPKKGSAEEKPAEKKGEHSQLTKFLVKIVAVDPDRAMTRFLPALKPHQRTLAMWIVSQIQEGNLLPEVHAGAAALINMIDKKQYRAWTKAMDASEVEEFNEILKAFMPDEEEDEEEEASDPS